MMQKEFAASYSQITHLEVIDGHEWPCPDGLKAVLPMEQRYHTVVINRRPGYNNMQASIVV